MTRYEYEYRTASSLEQASEITNELGLAGWELMFQEVLHARVQDWWDNDSKSVVPNVASISLMLTFERSAWVDVDES
jgi:hypothetical protein